MHRLNILQKRPLDALLYPPRPVCAEPRAPVGVKVINGSYETQIPFLYQVTKTHSMSAVLFGDIDHKPEVTPHQLVSGPWIILLND
jgi:hypothetical protein